MLFDVAVCGLMHENKIPWTLGPLSMFATHMLGSDPQVLTSSIFKRGVNPEHLLVCSAMVGLLPSSQEAVRKITAYCKMFKVASDITLMSQYIAYRAWHAKHKNSIPEVATFYTDKGYAPVYNQLEQFDTIEEAIEWSQRYGINPLLLYSAVAVRSLSDKTRWVFSTDRWSKFLRNLKMFDQLDRDLAICYSTQDRYCLGPRPRI
jgi:hypothetical protein